MYERINRAVEPYSLFQLETVTSQHFLLTTYVVRGMVMFSAMCVILFTTAGGGSGPWLGRGGVGPVHDAGSMGSFS